ncbi:MAG TPA: hypothetical protein PKY81_13785 [bacterium]|nr:hypothetical protein [bacterium]HPN32017.1 hypothetical protein [bacterium]
MNVSNILFVAILLIFLIYLFFNEYILEDYIYPYIEIGGLLFGNLFHIIIVVTLVFVVFNIYRKFL